MGNRHRGKPAESAAKAATTLPRAKLKVRKRLDKLSSSGLHTGVCSGNYGNIQFVLALETLNIDLPKVSFQIEQKCGACQ